MAQKVIKVGNSAAITLSQSVLDALGVAIGDEVELERLQNDVPAVIIRPRHRTTDDKNRRENIARWTLDFIERYRDDLEALANK